MPLIFSKKNKPFHYYFQLILLLWCMVVVSGCGIGSDPPEHKLAMLSLDGKKIVQVYSIFFCISFSSGGGLTQRSGPTTYYMDIYDAQTGQKTIAESIKLEGKSDLYAVTDRHILMKTWDSEKSRDKLQILDMTGKEVFSDEQLAKLNNGLLFETYHLFYNLSQQKGIPMLANDARMYLLDDQTGKATILPDSLIAKENIEGNFEEINYMSLDSVIYSFKGTNRKKLACKTRISKDTVITLNVANIGGKRLRHKWFKENETTSKADYISPYLIGETRYYPHKLSREPQEQPICIDNGYLMLSKTKLSNDYEWQFTLIDKNALTEKWVAVLKKPEGFTKNDNLKFVKLIGTDLIIITEKSINRLDLKTGKWAWNQWCWSKEED